MTMPLLPDVPVTDDTELTARWRAVTDHGAGPPTRRTVYLMWLRADGTMVPLLVPVDDIPLEPDREMIAHLAGFHEEVARQDGVPAAELHLALCLERRGPAWLSPDDHAWVAAVDTVLRAGVGLDCSVHVGNGRRVVPALPRTSWPVS